jgi:hypothetical protein
VLREEETEESSLNLRDIWKNLKNLCWFSKSSENLSKYSTQVDRSSYRNRHGTDQENAGYTMEPVGSTTESCRKPSDFAGIPTKGIRSGNPGIFHQIPAYYWYREPAGADNFLQTTSSWKIPERRPRPPFKSQLESIGTDRNPEIGFRSDNHRNSPSDSGILGLPRWSITVSVSDRIPQ